MVLFTTPRNIAGGGTKHSRCVEAALACAARRPRSWSSFLVLHCKQASSELARVGSGVPRFAASAFFRSRQSGQCSRMQQTCARHWEEFAMGIYMGVSPLLFKVCTAVGASSRLSSAASRMCMASPQASWESSSASLAPA